MQQIFLAIIGQLNSSVFILLAILALIALFLFKAGKWSQKFLHQDEKISDLKGLSEKILVMQTKIDLIYQYSNPNSPVKAFSPIALTESGKQICREIKADAIVDKYYEDIKREINSINPKNAYDIQNVSLRLAKEKMLDYFNEDELSLIKQEAYLKGLLVEDVLSVFGILIRNRILKEKHIPISEVDKHKPVKK